LTNTDKNAYNLKDMIKQYTKKADYSYTFGFYPTFNLINYHKDSVILIYVDEKSVGTDGYNKLISLVGEKKVVVSQNAFNKLSEKGNDHVIGVFKKYSGYLNKEAPHVVLVNPSDQGNLGNIMRSMLAFNFKDLAVILPGADIFSPKTIRASMGAFFAINHQTFDSFDEYLVNYPRKYYPFMLQAEKYLNQVEKDEKIYALVFGNEATGLPEEFLNENALKIEQSEEVDSLNLATAAVVALYSFSVVKR